MTYYKLNTDGTIQSSSREHEGFSPMSELTVDAEGNYYSHYLPTGEPDIAKIDLVAVEATQAEFRAERDVLLAEADIEINKLVDAGLATTVYSEYRQALRDSTLVWVLPTKP